MTDAPDTPKDPWDTMCNVVDLVRDFFAAIGVVATLAFIIGYFWVVPV